MKFIYWTLVYQGLTVISDAANIYLWGGYKAYLQHYGEATVGIAQGVSIFLWIFLYVIFIRNEAK